ncbi:MAG TPA: monofunctional biosynthetic peptidoglycan transglycosylase [Burkholderiaceae bacterium]|nr:monofunctional biosynthetic peptidoglycan transglycosylase [Burkholderiaceae bacterium]
MAAKRGIGRRIGRALGWTIALAIGALVALQLWYLGHVVWWKWQDPSSTAFMRAQLETLREKDPGARLRHQWVPYARISPHLKRAVIAAEDAKFTGHDGVDWEAIERAHERNQRRGRVTHGGSTITMQLAKNLFLSGERSYLRKAQELAIAFMLEAVLTKDRILEIYLNVAEWGVGTFGAEAAAHRHFGTTAAQLTPAQAARLAAMLPRPRYYDRNPGSPVLARRAATIQRWMGGVDAP